MTRRLATALLYAAAFLLQYRLLTQPLYGYWGFSQVPLRDCLWLLPLMALPALALPARLDRPSGLFAFLNYAIVYVPLCVLLFHSTRTDIPAARLWAIWAGVALATAALARLPRWEAPPLRGPRLGQGLLAGLAWGVIALALLAALKAGHFHFAGLKHTGLARAAYGADTAGLGAWFRYADAWTGLALVPWLLSDGLRRRAWPACLALGGVCVVFFLLSGRKTELFCPVAVAGAWLLLRGEAGVTALLLGLAGLLVLPLGLRALGAVHLADVYANVLNFRVFAVPQILVPQYDAYYSAHGYTLYRHVALVNRLFFNGRPFDQPWSVIAAYYYHAQFTADAMPYATDGLAALGLAGLGLVTLLLLAVFRVFDRIARPHPALLVLPALMPFLFSLLNNSLFTSLLTGGGFVLMVVFACEPETV